MNCALISDSTNLNIGRKDPLKYLKERHEWVSEDIVHERLNSHLIPVKELANGGYEGITERERKEKITYDFDLFLAKRAEYMTYAAEQLVKGKDIYSLQIINSVENKTGAN